MSQFFVKHPYGILAKVMMTIMHEQFDVSFSDAANFVAERIPVFESYKDFENKKKYPLKDFINKVLYKRVFQCYYENGIGLLKWPNISSEHPLVSNKIKQFYNMGEILTNYLLKNDSFDLNFSFFDLMKILNADAVKFEKNRKKYGFKKAMQKIGIIY